MITIGECINSTSKRVSKAVKEKDEEFLLELARSQSEAGVDYIGVNVGTGRGSIEEEVSDIKWLVGLIQDNIDGAICIDSSDPAVITAGMEVRGDRPTMINSVKAQKKNMDIILPLAKAKGAPLVGLAMDDTGIPSTESGRLAVCEILINGLRENGIPLHQLYIDPIVMPISTGDSQGLTTLETLKKIKESFPEVKTVLGLSNISFGLPGRTFINQAMLSIAMYLGLDAVIINPLDQNLDRVIKATEAIMARDRRCRRYLKAYRKK
jgi:5-methyltetrahydrofolate--homocysteine methyltransferase